MNEKIYEFLLSFQQALSLSDLQMCEYLKISLSLYADIKLKHKLLPVINLKYLFDKFGLSFSSVLVENQIDYKAIVSSFGGKKGILPKRYMGCNKSKRRAAVYMLEYIEKTYGYLARNMMLRKLQLDEECFSDPDAENNIFLAIDICEKLYKYNLNIQEFRYMGSQFFETCQHTQLGEILRTSANLTDCYEFMVCEGLLKYVEKNYNWRIEKLKNGSCEIAGSLDKELSEAFDNKDLNSHPMSKLREGFISCIPKFLGYPNAHVVQTKALHNGDKMDLFKVILPEKITQPFEQFH